jgi:hypothetical protein
MNRGIGLCGPQKFLLNFWVLEPSFSRLFPWLTSSLTNSSKEKLDSAGFAPAAPTLQGWCSTAELRARLEHQRQTAQKSFHDFCCHPEQQ